MAEAVGADVVQAAVEGRVPETAIRTMVVTCSRCQSVGSCLEWLEEHAAGAQEAPDYCLNKGLFERVKGA
ncbi:MAG: hypothetical protein D6811_09255 [Alphaproteobacteria bacterium]|nr:MAG: hypothetical protein D6811_09255 [Alphaproteobacteria bacterium]